MVLHSAGSLYVFGHTVPFPASGKSTRADYRAFDDPFELLIPYHWLVSRFSMIVKISAVYQYPESELSDAAVFEPAMQSRHQKSRCELVRTDSGRFVQRNAESNLPNRQGWTC